MRSELEKRIRRQRAELDAIEKDLSELEFKKRTCQAVLVELEALLRYAPKDDSESRQDRQLRVNTDPYRAREVLRKQRAAMHVKDIIAKIGGPNDRNRRSSMASQLGSYARRNEIFQKVEPNTFGLLDYGPEPVGLEESRTLDAALVSDDNDDFLDAFKVSSWHSDDDIPF